jgi:hypothetical protein
MPDLGIGETLAAFGGGDLLAGLFGGGEAAAAGGTGVLSGAGAADLLAPSGAGLFGGTTGLAGTELAAGAGTDLGALTATGGLSAAGTAADFLAAPGASGFNAGALTPGIGEAGGGPGVLGATSPPPTPAGAGGTSVFDTGGQGLTGVSSTGAPSSTIAPPGASAASVAAPSSVSAPVDATSAALNPAPGAEGPPAPAGATPSSSIDQLLSKAGNSLSPGNLANSAIDSLTKNPLGVALGLGGLGYNIYQGQKNTANQAALTADANTATANSNQMVASGEALQQYLTSGTLPPQYMTQVQQAIQDAKTAAISNAASQGQPTDPSQNTALQATLAKIDQQEPAMITQVASQLFSSGSSLVSAGQSAAGLSGQLFQSLVQNDTTQAANTGKAIASLAAALNGKTQASGSGSGGTTVTIG